MHQGSVLIVEDDGALRHSLKSMLEALNFEVREAWSGETALAELRIKAPEVVLLDLNMPGIGGMTACGKMKEIYPLLPIIVLTVRDHEEDIAEFNKEANGGQNPAVKDFATQTLPTLQDHLKEAKEMRQNVAPGSPAAAKNGAGNTGRR